MRPINWGRVILGGLVAGIVINISEFLLHAVVLKKDEQAAMTAMNKAVGMTGTQTLVWVIFGFVVGIAAVWLYAAIRPRYGAGVGTAARAGIVVWFFGGLLSSVAMWNMGLFSGIVLTLPIVWELVQNIIAVILGAWLYKEDVSPA